MMKKTILSIMMLAFIGLSTTYGQVGIGTENPQARLHVDGQQNNPVSGTPTNLQQEDDFVVTNQGQVGVGTTSPTQKLDVKGTIKGSEELIIGTNWLGGGALSIKNNDASKNVATFTSSTNNWAAVITDDRFFGVNTENPTERLDVNGKLRIRETPILATTSAQQLFVDENGVVGKFNSEGPKTVYYENITNVSTSASNNVTAFNNSEKMILNIQQGHRKLNTLGSSHTGNVITIPEDGFYQISASISTSISTGTAGQFVFQVLNIEKSSDGGSTWEVVSGLRGLHTMALGVPARYYINVPTIVTELNANDRLRLVTFRPLSSANTGLGSEVDTFTVTGVTAQGTRAYTLGLIKL